MSESFTKLFSTILYSTVWAEDHETRLVWITMLAMADQRGYVGASVPGLAAAARVPLSACERALAKFLAPDLYSRSKEHEGRRIEEADRGWRLLNYTKFREARSQETRREQYRAAKRRARDKSKQRRETEAYDSCAGGLAPDYVYDQQDDVACDGD
jgi:hypothetical protein